MPPKSIDDLKKQTVLREYTKYYPTGEDVLASLMALTPIEPKSKRPLDRFSFIDRAGIVRNEIQNGISESFGMTLFFLNRKNESNADLYVKMVDNNSPAKAAGIKRGTRIKSINGVTALDYNTQVKQDFKFINDALKAHTITLVVANEGKADATVTLTNSSYVNNSLLSTKIFEQGNKKIGYLAFSSFLDIYNRFGGFTSMYRDFENIFNDFQSQGIDELIVDLRYNGGGSTNTAEYLANRIAPTSANGQLMYTSKVNKYLEELGYNNPGQLFAPVNFQKIGSINLSKVFFLVTKYSASASELLINVLEPYMDVQVVGSLAANGAKENTYGKPVGFFGIYPVDDNLNVELFPTSFQMFNARGYGDYFSGLVPDTHVYEDFFKDFGDQEEGMIAEALHYIANNSYQKSTSNARSITSYDPKKAVDFKSFERSSISEKGMFKFAK